MASTSQKTLAGLAGSLVIAANAAAATAPETATLTPAATKTSCVLQLNEFKEGPIEAWTTSIDERVLRTTREKENAWWLVGVAGDRGVTFTDKNGTIDISFQARGNLNGWLMPGEKERFKSNDSVFSGPGYFYPAQYKNWTQSARADIQDPKICEEIKAVLQAPPPDFNAVTFNSKTFSNNLWSKTGLSSDFDILAKTTGVKIVSREERLAEDRASGQLPQTGSYFGDKPVPQLLLK